MAAGKHSKGRHSAPKGGRREFDFPRGPKDPEVLDEVEVPEEIAKTAAGKMQTAEASHDETPDGEAETGASLDDWVEGQAPKPDEAARKIDRKGKVAIAIVVVAAIAIVAAIVFAATFRPVSTPSQVVQAALEDVREGDFDDLSQLYAGDSAELESTLENALSAAADLGSESELRSRLNDEQKKTLSEIAGKMADFDYTLGAESVDGDTATVEVTVATYDLGKFAQAVLGDYIADGLKAASKGDLESSADASTRFVGVLREHLGDLGSKDRQAETTFTLERGDGGEWKLSELTRDNLDALTGGLISTAADMAAQLADGDES